MIPITSATGLTDGEVGLLNKLVMQLQDRNVRNKLRQRYFDSKQVVRQLGIAIPPSMAMIETVVGLPAKAVNILERRIHFDGLAMPGTDDPFGLSDVLALNDMHIEAPMLHKATLKYGVGFIAVTRGDVASGEPEVLMTPRSALHSTAQWDSRRRRLSAALSIIESDDIGEPTALVLYLPDKVATLTVNYRTSKWDAVVVGHGLGRVPVAMQRYDPDTDDRPMGRSKITRTVMSLTDQIVRTLLRTEVSAEFYSAPQRYILGADEGIFKNADGTMKTGWEVTIGKMLAIGGDEDGEKPTVGQFPQMTMQPHTDQLRSLVAMFAGETNLPVNSLGIIHENPASDAAMHTAYLDLIQDAERCHTTFGAGWVDAGRLAVMVRDNLSALPGELAHLSAKFRDASVPTRAAATQAVVEQVREGILPADSEVTLEQLGYDATTISRIVADRRRAEAANRLSMLAAAAAAARQTPQVAAAEERAPEDSPDDEEV